MDGKIGEALRARLESAQEHDTFEVDIFIAGEPAKAVAAFTDADIAGGDSGDDRQRHQRPRRRSHAG